MPVACIGAQPRACVCSGLEDTFCFNVLSTWEVPSSVHPGSYGSVLLRMSLFMWERMDSVPKVQL